ncbi:hypothetical protein CBL_04724 [Carabus blaptoides fortunei]
MFCKSLIVFGLLAAFSVQGMEATQLDTRTVDLRSLGDLIDQVRELIKNLNNIVSGVLENALGTLKGLIDTIKALKEKFINEGLTTIKDIIEGGLDFITNKTEEAAQLGIDISKCIIGKQDELTDLATSLAGELSDCVSEPITDALAMVNNDLKIIGEITKNITNLPAQLAKCLISLKPITCLTNMVTNLSKVLFELPDQISGMIDEVLSFVGNLSETLGECVNGITVTANSKVEAMIDEISKCIEPLLPEEPFHF